MTFHVLGGMHGGVGLAGQDRLLKGFDKKTFAADIGKTAVKHFITAGGKGFDLGIKRGKPAANLFGLDKGKGRGTAGQSDGTGGGNGARAGHAVFYRANLLLAKKNGVKERM
jgi:hypothetical protein